MYTPAEVRTLTPVRENVEKRASIPDLRLVVSNAEIIRNRQIASIVLTVGGKTPP